MSDRHFDTLATRFAEKIYGTPKGAIRLAVLQADLHPLLSATPLRVLDIGGGLGHMALWLARQGHQVTLVEPAAPMLEAAQKRFAEAGEQARFIHSSWQALEGPLADQPPFDVVLCHAVLEWLEQPEALLPMLHNWTHPESWLSLAFYNKDALIYRNLLKGHFRKLRQEQFAGEHQSLTPQHPLDPRALAVQLGHSGWQIRERSGIRVFHDYMPSHFQQRTSEAELVERELHYRRHPSFAGLGRYLHWLCQHETSPASGITTG